MAAELPAGIGLCVRQVRIARREVAWLRYVLEAHEGLAFMHSDGSGLVSLLTSDSQLAALELLIADLIAEGVVQDPRLHGQVFDPRKAGPYDADSGVCARRAPEGNSECRETTTSESREVAPPSS